MPVGQDQVGTIISSVSNTLDPLSFYDALETNAIVKKLKMSIGATGIISSEKPDGLWTSGEPWHVTIDISSLETMVDDLESEVSAAIGHTKGVTPERLSKIWLIDIETAKRTIDLTSQHVKHEGSDHLKHLIYWTSKKQKTIETSSFGSEFMDTKHATEYVRSL